MRISNSVRDCCDADGCFDKIRYCVLQCVAAKCCSVLQNVAACFLCVEICSNLTQSSTATRCNMLQHTAAHCSTMRLSATHCSTLRHIAAHCYSLQQTAANCSKLQQTEANCNTLQHTAPYYNTLQ